MTSSHQENDVNLNKDNQTNCPSDLAQQHFDMAMRHHKGDGIPQDDEEAAEWFKKSAAKGYDLAQYHLGEFYLKGVGVPHNGTKAIDWLNKAAEQENLDAINLLYSMNEALVFSKICLKDFIGFSERQRLGAN